MKMKKKLRSAAGESIAEVLIAVLILSVGFLIVVGATESAARVNERIKNEDVAFDVTDVDNAPESAKITVTMSGETATADVNLYKTKKKAYYYYDVTEIKFSGDEPAPEP